MPVAAGDNLPQFPDIEQFICLVRESFCGADYVYTHGSCYQFYRILASVYPKAQPYYKDGHVIARIGDAFYDINGTVDGTGYVPHQPGHGCNTNRFSLWGNGWECPNCDEITYYGTLCFPHEPLPDHSKKRTAKICP